VPGLVRAPWSGVDRVRADPGRRDRAPGAFVDADRGDLDGGAVGVRPRTDRLAGRQPLRRLVRRPQRGSRFDAGERAGHRTARPRPRTPEARRGPDLTTDADRYQSVPNGRTKAATRGSDRMRWSNHLGPTTSSTRLGRPPRFATEGCRPPPRPGGEPGRGG